MVNKDSSIRSKLVDLIVNDFIGTIPKGKFDIEAKDKLQKVLNSHLKFKTVVNIKDSSSVMFWVEVDENKTREIYTVMGFVI